MYNYKSSARDYIYDAIASISVAIQVDRENHAMVMIMKSFSAARPQWSWGRRSRCITVFCGFNLFNFVWSYMQWKN